jgi:hypothetical protein
MPDFIIPRERAGDRRSKEYTFSCLLFPPAFSEYGEYGRLTRIECTENCDEK